VHLVNGEEKSGSSAYVPPDPKNDKQLIYALALVRGEKPPFDPSEKKADATPTPAPAAPAPGVPKSNAPADKPAAP